MYRSAVQVDSSVVSYTQPQRQLYKENVWHVFYINSAPFTFHELNEYMNKAKQGSILFKQLTLLTITNLVANQLAC